MKMIVYQLSCHACVNKRRLSKIHENDFYGTVWTIRRSTWNFFKLRDQNGPRGKDKGPIRVLSIN